MADEGSIGRLALSPMQQGMLYHHLSGGPADVDLQQILLRLPEPIDADRMRRAWDEIARRHPTLRSRFSWDDRETPVRSVLPEVEVVFDVHDLTGVLEADREDAAERQVQARRAAGVDPSAAPLFSVDLLQFADDRNGLLWSFHHLVMDGQSTARVLREVFEVYDAIGEDREPDLEPLPDETAFLTWLDERETDGELDYWQTALDGFDSATPVPGHFGAGAKPAPGGGALEEAELRLTSAETSTLTSFCEVVGSTPNALVQAAWSVLLSRFATTDDVVYGVTRAARGPAVEASQDMVGVLIQTHPVRVRLENELSVRAWLEGLKRAHRAMGTHFMADLATVQAASDVAAGASLFESLYMYDHEEMQTSMRGLGGAWAKRDLRIIERPPYPLTLYAYGEQELLLRIVADRGLVEPGTPSRLLGLLRHVLLSLADDPDRTLGEAIELGRDARESVLELGRGLDIDLDATPLPHVQILGLGTTQPEARALVAGDRTLSFRELADAVATCGRALRARGIGPGGLVGVEGERSIETIVALLAVLDLGAAYVPLDPSYPESRLRFMADDAGLSLILLGPGARTRWDETQPTCRVTDLLAEDAGTGPEATTAAATTAADRAYVIYTSGSTGKPKGVTVDHGNVRNFLAAMDAAVRPGDPATWLSVTPLSFDISVLELFWTLSRGWCVALPDPEPAERASEAADAAATDDGPSFGLFYFAAASSDEAENGYRLLLDGARKADALGLSSIWTPERHFHEFGGLYPNPSVAGAAVAAVTQNLSIRAGSVVLPLHDPIRVAEEWAVIDNLSQGRAGVAFASGWQKNDFVLAPDNYEDRHAKMYRGIDIVQRLWKGDEVFVPGVGGESVGVRLFPRPIQPSLPMWLTAAGSPETFRKAGEVGAGVLTHLLGQSVEDLGGLIEAYREARRDAGHGPGPGQVAVMLHTYIGEDDAAVRELVRGPLRDYLRSSVSLIKNYSGVWANKKSDGAAAQGDEFEKLSPEDLEALLDQAFERYYETSGLLGTPEKCADLVERLSEAGVDEIACLIDFGVPTEEALDGIDQIGRLAGRFSSGATTLRTDTPSAADAMVDVPSLIARHRVKHMQCTPSLLRMLLADAEGRTALAALELLLVGGEAFPKALADQVAEVTDARILNMYGPTETTVWSSVGSVRDDATSIVSLGRPIANTTLYVLDEAGRLLPPGAPGELYIGGDGVAVGYLDRPDLTDTRFLADPFASTDGARMYRTGDRVRWGPGGELQFLGRVDQQVKIRGHRVELGEIEATLRSHPDIADVAVVIRGASVDGSLAAFYVPHEGGDAGVAKAWLADRLPGHMVPTTWTAMDALPLTPNGKIDRNALPDPDDANPGFVSEGDTVHALAAIWSDVLGVETVDASDDFFELGGNSLSTIQVAFQIRKSFGIELPLRSFFQAPTVAQLAAKVDEELLAQADTDDLDALVAELEGLSDEEAARLVNG